MNHCPVLVFVFKRQKNVCHGHQPDDPDTQVKPPHPYNEEPDTLLFCHEETSMVEPLLPFAMPTLTSWQAKITCQFLAKAGSHRKDHL